MRRALFFGILAMALVSCSSPGPKEDAAEVVTEVEGSLPKGWREATPVKKSACKRGRDGLLAATADFDGDGLPDLARILSRQDGKSIGVWVWLSSQKDPVRATIASHRDGKHDMALGIAPPGSYPTACGKGHWPCGDKEPAELTLDRPAVDFYTCGGSNRFLRWEPPHARFVTTWMSD